MVEDFVANVAADTRINARFAKTNIPHLKQMLVGEREKTEVLTALGGMKGEIVGA